jgi:adenosylcobinamide-GDP ribazoletransferase
VPVPFKFAFDVSRMDFYLPLVGFIVALIQIVVYWAALFLTASPMIAVIFVLLIQYLCFNLFHLDGLADTADAFLGTVDKEKTFAILKDSRVGTYGLFAGIMIITIKIALLSTLLTRGNYFSIFVWVYPIAGRFSASILAAISMPAKDAGLGTLAKESRLWRGIAGCITASLFYLVLVYIKNFFLVKNTLIIGGYVLPFDTLLVSSGIALLLSFAAAFLSAFFYSAIHKKRIGGYTGDALGAAIETSEALFLLLLVICINFA